MRSEARWRASLPINQGPKNQQRQIEVRSNYPAKVSLRRCT
jgi:hypothetical protein